VRLRLTGAVLVLLGLVAAGTAVASATLWRPADHVRAEALATGATTLLVTDPGVLELVAGSVSVRATAPEGARVVVAVGRDSDVTAWVGADAHTRVTGLADVATLATRPGEAVEVPGATPSAGPDASADPADSDMWVASAEGVGSAELSWTHRPGRWSLLVATTDAGGVAPTLELTWPREVVTPWFRPGLWTGIALILLGAAVVLVGWRRSQETEPRWVDVDAEPEVAADVETTVPEPEQPTAPLTRRQLRELEAARAAGRGARSTVPTVRRGSEAPVEVASGPSSLDPPSAVPTTASTTTASTTTAAPASSPTATPGEPTPGEPTASEPEAQDQPYVPKFVPVRRGGVVPHVPSSPAARPAQPPAPAPRWTPTAPAATPTGPPAATTAWSATAESAAPAPQAAAEPAEPAGPGTGPTHDTQTPGRGALAVRRLLRRRESGVGATHPEALVEAPATSPEAPLPAGQHPDPARPPGAEPSAEQASATQPTEVAPGASPSSAQQGAASADAWRARWGFVEVPPESAQDAPVGGDE